MNDLLPFQPGDRATGAAQFFSRVQRYKSLLKRRWWVLLLTLGIAVGAQTYRASKAPLTYISKAQMIMGNRSPIADPNSAANEESFVGTTIALLKGNLITTRATEKVTAAHPELPRRKVTLEVQLAPKTSIFLLQARSTSPNYTRAYLDALMEEFLKYRLEIRGKTTEDTIKDIKVAADKAHEEVIAGKKELENFQKTNSVAFVEEQARNAGTRLVSLDNDLVKLQTEYRVLELMQTSPGGNGKNDKTQSSGADIRDEDQVRRQIALLKVEKEEREKDGLLPRHPKMIKLNEQIATQERLLEVFKDQSATQLALRRTQLENAIKAQQALIEEQKAVAQDASARLGEYGTIKGRVNMAETFYVKVTSLLDTVRIGGGVQPENISVLEPAGAALPDNSGFTKNIIIGCFIGLVFGVGLLFLLDRFDDRPVSFTELQEHFDELILGQIPQDSTRSKERRLLPLTANDTRYAYAEAHRNLRSSLIFMAIEGARPRTIVVTSAVPGEGKSTVTVNLAVTMAFAGSRVLLVDADLRRGTVHQYFEVSEKPGFAQVLAGELSWDKAIQQTHVPNLHVLSRGHFLPNPGELILAGVDAFLREVSPNFDFVLFDSAPVLAADDTASLAPKVDGTLFVIRAGYTSARLGRNALELLYQRQVNVMGLVFNSVETNSREYYYFKYPEYYSKSLAQR